VAEPLAAGSAWLVAVIVRLDGEGRTCGAEYVAVSAPAEVGTIVPRAELPPGTLLTLQFTAMKVAFFTTAVNGCVWPRKREVIVGCTVTITGGGGGEDEEPRPQPANWRIAARGNNIERQRRLNPRRDV
jgi:hypothetical protein